MLTGSCYRAVNDYTFSPPPFGSVYVWSRGVGWLISYITSSAVALYPDCLTSPSLSPASSSQLPLLSSFASNPPGQIRTVGSH